MGKIIMPKNSALLNEIESVLQIYYDENDWLTNDIYKARLKLMIGDDQYQSSYTKKAQITSYFGFTIWENIRNPQSRRRITESGKKMYKAIKENNKDKIQEVLMNSLETVKFGRNNYGCPDSDSDVEPPALYIRAILDLGYLTYREFAFLLWKLEDLGCNYTDALLEVRNLRDKGTMVLDEKANKYADCKPIMILVRWGFLAEDEITTGGKHIIIAPEVFKKYRNRLRNLKIYNIDMNYDDALESHNERIENDNDNKIKHIEYGANTIFYGAPGTGKSHRLDEMANSFDFIERVTFYPEYTHDDFIGCFMPCMTYVQDYTSKYISADGTLSKIPGKPVPYYTYVPGPFTNALVDSLNNPDKNALLIIEELNRANAAAVFGEIFQLLDREDSGESKYSISISNEYSEYLSSEIATYSKGEKIKIPDNLTICATMNSADQGVNPLDSAFKRRWNFEYIPIDFSKAKHKDYEIDYANKKVTWEVFATTINEQLKSKDINEDKHLGQYFITESEIVDSYKFASKIFLYLFDDVLKFNRRGFFKNYKTFSDLLTAFNEGKEVFEFTFKYVEASEESKEENSESFEVVMNIDAESKLLESSDIRYEEKLENEDIGIVAEE